MAKPKKIPNVYAMHAAHIEVRGDLEDPEFEDVTFLVWNCTDRRKAVKQVKAYIARLVEEATKQ
jgi:hypothetical protein